MALYGARFDEDGVAQTAAFGGLRLFASNPEQPRTSQKNGWSALHNRLVYFQGPISKASEGACQASASDSLTGTWPSQFQQKSGR